MNYVYEIKNTESNKSYIGITNNHYRRMHRHFSELRNNKHENSHLQRSFNKHGEENFAFDILLEIECSREELYEIEKEYIEKYNSFNNGYNQNLGGIGNNGFASKISHQEAMYILSIANNVTKSGRVLAEKFEVTRTTISRIKRGESHTEAYSEYSLLSESNKNILLQESMQYLNIEEELTKANLKKFCRKLEKEVVFIILSLLEFDNKKKTQIQRELGLKDGAIHNLLHVNSYLDFKYEYNNMPLDERLSFSNSI